MKLNALKFALAGGISVSIMVVLTTVAAILRIPGYVEFSVILESFYGFYGYSVSWLGVIVGAFWGFVEGFVWTGLLGWVYNKLVK
jgi:hypothetical protein